MILSPQTEQHCVVFSHWGVPAHPLLHFPSLLVRRQVVTKAHVVSNTRTTYICLSTSTMKDSQRGLIRALPIITEQHCTVPIKAYKNAQKFPAAHPRRADVDRCLVTVCSMRIKQWLHVITYNNVSDFVERLSK